MAQLVKTMAGLAIASVKTVNGLAIASVKTVAGLDNTSAGGPSPIGWWKFNDASGNTAVDSSGNGNSGTISGTASWTTGPNSNGALSFNGTDNVVTVANESFFDFERTNTFSFTGWVRWVTTPSGNRSIWNKQSTTGNQPGISIKYDADNHRVKVSLVDSTGAEIVCNTATSSLPPSTWFFLAITYSGSSNGTGIKVYIDNGGATTGAAGTLANSILNDNQLLIGNGDSGFFQGIQDDVRVYNVELTSGEVATIFAAGAQ